MRIYQLKKSSLANEFDVQSGEAPLVMKDQGFALIWGAAQTQQWNMRIHVAIPPWLRTTQGLSLSLPCRKAVGTPRCQP